jgi:hypothetical protein
VGLTAGTSTPDSTIQAVEAALKRLERGSLSRESQTPLATQRVALPDDASGVIMRQLEPSQSLLR